MQSSICEYSHSIAQAFTWLVKRNYKNAVIHLEHALKVANSNNDLLKKSECYLHLSVCCFHVAKFENAMTYAVNASKTFNKYIKSKQLHLQMIPLYIHIHVNLMNCYLLNNQCDNALKTICDLITYVDNESNVHDKYNHIVIIIQHLFCVKSLTKQTHNNPTIQTLEKIFTQYDQYTSQSSKISSLISPEYISTLSSWIKSFKREISKIHKQTTKNNALRALFFVLFVYEVVKMKLIEVANANDNNNNKVIHNKKLIDLTELCDVFQISHTYLNEIKKSSAKALLNMQNTKIQMLRHIYITLYKKEKEYEDILNNNNNSINNQSDDNSNNSDNNNNNLSISFINKSTFDFENEPCSPIIIKIILNYAISSLSSIKQSSNTNSLITLLTQTQSHIQSQTLPLSYIHLRQFTGCHTIINSLINLIENLVFIYEKQNMYNTFKKYIKHANFLRMLNTNRIISTFNHKQSNNICNGHILVKVNFNSKGLREHFYMFDKANGSVIVKDKQIEGKVKYHIHMKDVLKVTYGLNTENVIKKYNGVNNDKLNSPWLFLSFVCGKRSYDLYLVQEKLINWFYGIKCYLYENEMCEKIVSVTYFVLNRIKLKGVAMLCEKDEDNEEKDKGVEFMDVVAKTKSVQMLSFVKVLLLYNSVCPLNGEG